MCPSEGEEELLEKEFEHTVSVMIVRSIYSNGVISSKST